MSPFSYDGLLRFRMDEALMPALWFQPPPRLTRYDPEEEPTGSVIPLDKSPRQSRHLSQTFPCIS